MCPLKRHASYKLLAIIVTLLLPSLLATMALAQESALFEITLVPQADTATAGEPFAYTLTLINIGRQPVSNVVVQTNTPADTTYARSHFSDTNWLVGGVQPGESGSVIWFSQESVAPKEMITFELVVNVSVKPEQNYLINNEYSVTTLDNSDVVISGPPIRTQLIIPTPVPVPETPTPESTTVSVVNSTSTPSPVSAIAATSTDQLEADRQISTEKAAEHKVEDTSVSFSPLFIIIVLVVPGLLIIGLVWFLKYRKV